MAIATTESMALTTIDELTLEDLRDTWRVDSKLRLSSLSLALVIRVKKSVDDTRFSFVEAAVSFRLILGDSGTMVLYSVDILLLSKIL